MAREATQMLLPIQRVHVGFSDPTPVGNANKLKHHRGKTNKRRVRMQSVRGAHPRLNIQRRSR